MVLRIPFFILILVFLETSFTATSNEDDMGRVRFRRELFNSASRPRANINATFESQGLSVQRYNGGSVLIKGEIPLELKLQDDMTDAQIILQLLRFRTEVYYTNFSECSKKLFFME